jgi:L-asparaginase II
MVGIYRPYGKYRLSRKCPFRRLGCCPVDAIEVEVWRGDVVESRHRIHAVAVAGARIVAEAGDRGRVAFFRSSAKPFQALPLARARTELDDRDLAIASASHRGEPVHVEAVEALLAKAPASEDDLACGTEGDPPRRIRHNCSGKHAGMLALCTARGWGFEGYRLPDHPVQQACLHEVADAADVVPDEIPTAADGCGVVTFALPLERMAVAFGRLESLDAGARVAAAMRAHPELIRGPGAVDTRLMQLLPGWTAKGGAEGLLCACGPGGVGVALKSEDGTMRGLGPALASFLSRLGEEVGELEATPVRNSRGEYVGDVRVASR